MRERLFCSSLEIRVSPNASIKKLNFRGLFILSFLYVVFHNTIIKFLIKKIWIRTSHRNYVKI